MEHFGHNERSSRDPRAPGNDHDSVADNPIRAIHHKVTRERAYDYALAEPDVFVQDGALNITIRANAVRRVMVRAHHIAVFDGRAVRDLTASANHGMFDPGV